MMNTIDKKPKDMSPKNILVTLEKGLEKAYAPYSHFHVSALIKTDLGDYQQGCNVENAAYPEGLCAEAVAIGQMITTGAHHIVDIYIMGTGNAPVSPCGGCRQKIREFAIPQTKIHLCHPQKGITHTFTIDELLPLSFGPEVLL